ncbi:unnamed protein product [Polarella glacialis]|uniref:Uncharacterized protein n=1 Tax=Polarella glacialis TaxID=89957 RepID=A0A813L7C3_POLGL|nr:unnamed protein product [Polarella glacialis]CAE8717029.1 unnamed protein product [Polarella glacialis]
MLVGTRRALHDSWHFKHVSSSCLLERLRFWGRAFLSFTEPRSAFFGGLRVFGNAARVDAARFLELLQLPEFENSKQEWRLQAVLSKRCGDHFLERCGDPSSFRDSWYSPTPVGGRRPRAG